MLLIQILIVSVLFLFVVDLFFTSNIPLHIAYIVLTYSIVHDIDMLLLNQLLFGFLIWLMLIIFHYAIWRKVIINIPDRFRIPNRYIKGTKKFIGKEGIIEEIEEGKFIFINNELHPFETEGDKEVIVGNKYKILKIKSNKLII